MGFSLGKVGGTLLGTALGGVGGGLLANQWGNLTKKPSVPGAPLSTIPMTASDVKINPTLTGSISPYGTNAYNAIGSNYAGAKNKLAGEASTLGMNPAAMTGPNSYAGQRLAATQGLDIGNLESALGGGLGNTAYSNAKEMRGYNQDTALANEIGALNKPDLLSEILGGVGNVGGTAAQIYGMYGKNKSNSVSGGAPDYGTASNPYGMDPSQAFGYNPAPYDWQYNWGGGR